MHVYCQNITGRQNGYIKQYFKKKNLKVSLLIIKFLVENETFPAKNVKENSKNLKNRSSCLNFNNFYSVFWFKKMIQNRFKFYKNFAKISVF